MIIAYTQRKKVISLLFEGNNYYLKETQINKQKSRNKKKSKKKLKEF